ncbi:hypothetical protein J6590_081267 [Homalodisca vitripennis]|nr:hypothetical protein J6590_081267 [Homalodisca vitripennis]
MVDARRQVATHQLLGGANRSRDKSCAHYVALECTRVILPSIDHTKPCGTVQTKISAVPGRGNARFQWHMDFTTGCKWSSSE